MKQTLFLAGLIFAALSAPVFAAASAEAPLDKPYPGMLSLSVDLRDAPRRIFRAHETIPVQPGALTLYYPKWIPGEHSPSGPIEGIAGLKISAAGKRIAWQRDLEDMYALHLEVPQGARELELQFEFLSPTDGGAFGQSVSATARLVDLEWNQVLFYPAGYFARQIQVRPKITVPEGWGYASALEPAGRRKSTVEFKAVSLATLVDSPLIAGKHFKRVDLGGSPAVRLNIVADRAENLAMTDDQLKHHRALVEQASALFGAHHYSHYDFLLTLSETTGHFGLEHHQSSDDRSYPDLFTDQDQYLVGSGLLPHEYVHSWNGKFRRPADLWTPNFNVPMKDDLLWVYEGLTEYLGQVLTARSGLRTPDQYRDEVAYTAARMSHRPGRSWRPLQDTADEAQLLYYVPRAWSGWRRQVDFYDEGELIWLDADTLIRENSGGQRSLDDFVKAFFGIDDGSFATVTYTFDDVVRALDQVQPYDWAGFLRSRLQSTDEAAPLEGLERGGWKLVYTDEPSAYSKAEAKRGKNVDLIDSLGVDIDDDDESKGVLRDVLWNSAAFEAGLVPGMKLIAVNGDKYKPEVLKDAIKAAKGGSKPMELLVANGNVYMTLRADYHGGLKYPHLVREEGKPDLLGAIAAPRK